MGAIPKQRPPELVQQIQRESIPSELTPLIEEYDDATEDRNPLLWKWLWHVFPEFRLSAVPDRQAGAARKAKFCLSLYMTVLDDVSERHRDRATFERGRKIPFEGMSRRPRDPDAEEAIVDVLDHAWEKTEEYLDQSPRAEGFRELFEFDLRQSLNTMDYNRLVNQGPELANRTGAELYDTHNMLLFLYVDVDLAFSPGFDRHDLAPLRELTWKAQRLVRISNWVSTWERELDETDYTSKVVVEAIDQGVITPSEVRDDAVPNERLADRIRETGIERELLLTWNRIYGELRNQDHGIDSVDVGEFLDGIRYLLEVDVKARGLK